MNNINTDEIIQTIIRNLNITKRILPSKSISVEQAKEALSSIPNGLDFFMSKNEALCKHYNLNYENIQKNKISIFDQIVDKYDYRTEKEVLLDIGSLKDYYFYTSRGCDFSRGESLLVPLIEYYHHKRENKDDFIDIHGTEALSYKIYEFDDFKIMVGAGCCNHRLYGMAKAFHILKDSKVLINSLDIVKVTFKESSIYEYITKNLLVKLSNGEFVITKLEDRNIQIESNNVTYSLSSNYSTQPCFENKLIIDFLENVKQYDAISKKFNITDMIFLENEKYDVKITCSNGNKNVKLIFDKNIMVDTMLNLDMSKDLSYRKLIKFSIHYLFGFYMIGNEEFYLKNIKDREERIYYLNKVFRLLI